jgi:ferredoxin-NADP reductase
MTARIIMKLRVQKARLTTPDVLHLHLVHPLRPELPEWSAGAHVDLRLPNGKVRQYSLCGDPNDRSHYEIAIKREADGRGGSIWAHENLKVGEIAHISAPRNNLPVANNAAKHVIIAGGIGITPFVAMAHELSAARADFQINYCARSAADAPLLDELRRICGNRLESWFSSDQRRFQMSQLHALVPGTHVYACGPARLLTAVQAVLTEREWPEQQTHMEVFQPTFDENFKAEPFDAQIASTGETLHVPANRSLLDVLRDHGLAMASSCELGVCGSCECGYRDGVVIHRDKVLPVSKRQDRLMPCVSRARVTVTLDL